MTQIEPNTRARLLGVITALTMALPVSGQNFTSDVTIDNINPGIHLTDTTSNEADWKLCVDDFCHNDITGLPLISEAFHVAWLDGASALPVIVERGTPNSALHLTSPGFVGINFNVPQAELDVRSVHPEIRLDDISLGHGQVDLSLSGVLFMIEGNSGQDIIELDTRAPANSIDIDVDGNVGVGTGVPAAKLHVAGNGRIDGDVALGSSRTVKTAFGTVNPAEVLARVADLPVASWRYKSEDEDTRHIGPFAEDFQRLFGLGDGETISIIDAQGVALAAIQGLQKELIEREAEVTELQERLAARDSEVRQRLERLERRLAAGDDGYAR